MIIALAVFLITYVLMLSLPKRRHWIALGSAGVFLALGLAGVIDYSVFTALTQIDFNVLLMIGGTMGIVTLFIESRYPTRLAELLISRTPNVQLAVAVLALFAGVISAFVDNVATVLMVAPVGLAISRKLKISPVPVIIAIAVSSNLQGAATLVGDTTSILLGAYAHMNFFDFFWMEGKPGIFWGVELGALASAGALLFLSRREKAPVSAQVQTRVEDYVPAGLLTALILCLIAASFLPQPEAGFLRLLYSLRSGLICTGLCAVGVIHACRKNGSLRPWKKILAELDTQTLLLLVGLFVVIGGIKSAGVIGAIGELFCRIAGDNPFRMYTLLVFASVLLSAFVDNIPYVATMLPVVADVAARMEGGAGAPYVFYFGLLSGATLGGNLTPIGASANIAAIGILRKNGETVSLRDFLRIGVPFTLAAVLAGYIYIWLVWGP